MEVVESSSAHIMQNVSRDEEAAVLKTRSCSLPGDYYFDQQERLVEACYYDSEGGQASAIKSNQIKESEKEKEEINSDLIKVLKLRKKRMQVLKSYQIKMESENNKHLVFLPFNLQPVKVDPICGIESSFIRTRLKNEYYILPLGVPIHRNTLLMVLYYCKKRAKIKLQHSHDDDDDDYVFRYCKKCARIRIGIGIEFQLQHHRHSQDDEDLTAQQKLLLKEFNSRFLQSIRLFPDDHHLLTLDVFYAAVYLHIKSLYDLVLDDVAAICDQLTPKQILKTFRGGDHLLKSFRSPGSFSWAFTINRTHNVDN